MRTVALTLTSLFLILSPAACGGGGDSGNGISDNSGDGSPATDGDTSTGMALVNGRIYTANPAQTWAEALVIKDGVIRFVGSTVGARDHIESGMEILDLHGKLALPGLHDVHMHPLEAGSEVVKCELSPEDGLPQWKYAISECANLNPGAGWLLGHGHGLDELLQARETPRAILDRLVPDRPIAIMEETSHSVWVNSKALEKAGITSTTPHPQGGAILQDTAGNPNGILLDAAGDMVFEQAFMPAEQFTEANYQGLLKGLAAVAKHGITSIADARVYWRRGYLDAWQRAERENKLTARATLGLWAYPGMDDAQQLAALKSMFSNDQTRLLRVNQIKFYVDGVLHNATAALHQPYREYFPEVGPVGLNYFSEERLERYIAELERVGFDAHIHAIGDRAVHEGLNAIQAARQLNGGASNARHRLTHLELVALADRPRFKAQGVIADFQVTGEFALPQNHKDMEPLIGPRAYEMLPLRAIWDTGATVTLSSDWDVSSPSPFVGMQHALQLGAQSLPNRESVVKAYTRNAAYALHQETMTGSLEVGKYGDVVVVNQNLFEVPVDEIGNTKVLHTLLGGKSVYRAR